MTNELNTIEQIKSHLDEFVGESVYLKANLGRRKSFEAEGILLETHPNVFVVKLNKENAVRRLSYTYADILTKTVELRPKEL